MPMEQFNCVSCLMAVWSRCAARMGRPVEPLGARHVDVGFVDGDHLQLGRETVKDSVNFLRAVAVARGMPGDEDGVRTKPGRGTQRHGGMHSELARLIGGRSYNAALVGRSSDDNRLILQRRIVELLHRDEESVHVYVEDGPRLRAHVAEILSIWVNILPFPNRREDTMIRAGIVLLGLFFWTASLMAQQATATSAQMQQLQQEVERLTSSLQAMRTEVQSCRDEIHSLRAELEAAKAAVQAGGSTENADVEHALADLREDENVTDSRVATLYQTKVESGSKYRAATVGTCAVQHLHEPRDGQHHQRSQSRVAHARRSAGRKRRRNLPPDAVHACRLSGLRSAERAPAQQCSLTSMVASRARSTDMFWAWLTCGPPTSRLTGDKWSLTLCPGQAFHLATFSDDPGRNRHAGVRLFRETFGHGRHRLWPSGRGNCRTR